MCNSHFFGLLPNASGAITTPLPNNQYKVKYSDHPSNKIIQRKCCKVTFFLFLLPRGGGCSS